MRGRLRIILSWLVLWLFVVSPLHAGASARPLSQAELSTLVANSAAITTVPEKLNPSLSAVSSDVPSSELSGLVACLNPTKLCSYGVKSSKTLILLTGDSHALMWAPPMAAIAASLGVRLSVAWSPGCPSTTVNQPSCTSFKEKVDATIALLRPSLVVLAERTSGLVAQPTWPSTDTAWAQGLAARMLRLEKFSKVALLYDTPPMPASPAACLAIDVTRVQRCGAPLLSENPAFQTKSQAEHDAVAYAHAAGIDPLPWLCASRCSPIIGTTVAYYDQTHLATSWVMKLATVLRAKVAPLIKR